MKNTLTLALICAAAIIMMASAVAATPFADGDNEYQNVFTEITDALLDGGAVYHIGDRMWVPWFSTSSSCGAPDLQRGGACNIGTVDSTHHCMVSDEFSEVALITSMTGRAEDMRAAVNTLDAIRSDKGTLPSWRIVRDGNTIIACDSRVNGNCDTASDADARFIIALWNAANNDAFPSNDRQDYANRAAQMAADFVKYNILVQQEHTTQGTITYWLAAGPGARSGGLTSTDFAYTGYYPDAIMGMLMSYDRTGDDTYLRVAKDVAKNYLLAANFDGNSFTASPGRSFRFTGTGTALRAECTGACNPLMWDGHDAARGLALCEAQEMAELMGEDVGLRRYCDVWYEKHLTDPSKVSTQYTPSGHGNTPQSGYFAQGLQARAMRSFGNEPYIQTLNNALAHYSPATRTWDWSACFGVYTQSPAIRALGAGLGKMTVGDGTTTPFNPIPAPDVPYSNPNVPEQPPTPEPTPAGIEALPMIWSVPGGQTVIRDETIGSCRNVEANTPRGKIILLVCEKDNGYAELYRQAGITDVNWHACIGSGCVDQLRGFARFKLATTTSQQPVPQPQQPVPQPQQPVQQPRSIEHLSRSCDIAGGCTLIDDVTSGVCRTVKWNTPAGRLQVLACDKGTAVEVYRQEHPFGGQFTACIGDGCVDAMRGFATTTI